MEGLTAWRTALKLFARFAYDTVLTAAIYMLLVGATLALRYVSGFLKASSFHYHVAEGLERAIFLSGTLVAALVLTYVTTIATKDLLRSLRGTLRHPVDHTGGITRPTAKVASDVNTTEMLPSTSASGEFPHTAGPLGEHAHDPSASSEAAAGSRLTLE